jgi:5-formyltetrahydrofolate cyclo-ligase
MLPTTFFIVDPLTSHSRCHCVHDMNTEKATLRQQLIAARRKTTEGSRSADTAALISHLLPLLADLHVSTVCSYVPIATEPGAAGMLDTLEEVVPRILLPVTATAADGTPLPLSWGRYRRGQLVAGRYGLLEPAGTPLPATAIGEAEVVIVPALAVDATGVRLGRGAGYYDRSLPLRDPTARLMAVVRDEEFVDRLPAEAHDIRMTDALTPGRGVVRFLPGVTGE